MSFVYEPSKPQPWRTVLGWTPQTDSLQNMKKQYMKLALQLHPNKNPGKEEDFKAATRAWNNAQAHYDPTRKSNDRAGGSSQSNDRAGSSRQTITVVFRFKRGRGYVERPAAIRVMSLNAEGTGAVPGLELLSAGRRLFEAELGGVAPQCLVKSRLVNPMTVYILKPRESVTVRVPEAPKPRGGGGARKRPAPSSNDESNEFFSLPLLFKNTQTGEVREAYVPQVQGVKHRHHYGNFYGSYVYNSARKLFGVANVSLRNMQGHYGPVNIVDSEHMRDLVIIRDPATSAADTVLNEFGKSKREFIEVTVLSGGPSATPGPSAATPGPSATTPGPSLNDNANFDRETKLMFQSKSGRGVALSRAEQQLRELNKARELAMRRLEKIKKLQRNLGNY